MCICIHCTQTADSFIWWTLLRWRYLPSSTMHLNGIARMTSKIFLRNKVIQRSYDHILSPQHDYNPQLQLGAAYTGHRTAVATTVIAVCSDSHLNEITRERGWVSDSAPPPPLQSQRQTERSPSAAARRQNGWRLKRGRGGERTGERQDDEEEMA